jgi:hypothetical protein
MNGHRGSRFWLDADASTVNPSSPSRERMTLRAMAMTD